MTFGTVGDYQVGVWSDALITVTHYASLHVSDPRLGDVRDSEPLADATYARAPVTFAVSGRGVANDALVQWENTDPVEVSFVGVCATATGEDLRFVFELPAPVSLPAGQGFLVAVGDLVISW